jgi:putative solute:sodium symporter small subunit
LGGASRPSSLARRPLAAMSLEPRPWAVDGRRRAYGRRRIGRYGREVRAMMDEAKRQYWRQNLRLMTILLSIWFTVSFLAGIVFVEQLNKIVINDFPLGFWFAQQGSIVVFVVLIFVYAKRMDKLDAEYGAAEREDEASGGQS